MAAPYAQDLVFTRGDDFSIALTMTTDGVNGISVAGWTPITAQLRPRADSTIVQSFGVVITNTAGGVLTLSLTAAQTQSTTLGTSCVWDLQRTASGALQTVVAGSVTIRPDVTRT